MSAAGEVRVRAGRDNRRVRLRTLAVDGVLALGVAGLAVVSSGQARPWHPAGQHVGVLGTALILGAALPLAVRRVWPLPVLAAAAAATGAYLILGFPYGPIMFAPAVAVYTVAALRPARTATVAAGMALPVLLAHIVVTGEALLGLLPGAAWVVVPFALGRLVRMKRELAGYARSEEVRRYTYEERLRIAQEVHDVVGHGLAAIHMQAEIALHLLPRHPEQAEPALAAISRTSKEALDELRATLAVVRRHPPGLAGLDQLASRVSDVGVPVDLTVTGLPRPVPSTVDLTAYRLVQEALTNVLRHAGPATAAVRIGYREQALTVEVTDTGTGARQRSIVDGGHGLAGMRERVTALDGVFEAGSRVGGGFRVYASLPLEATA
jgi:signal transduction histidine kinase